MARGKPHLFVLQGVRFDDHAVWRAHALGHRLAQGGICGCRPCVPHDDRNAVVPCHHTLMLGARPRRTGARIPAALGSGAARDQGCVYLGRSGGGGCRQCPTHLGQAALTHAAMTFTTPPTGRDEHTGGGMCHWWWVRMFLL